MRALLLAALLAFGGGAAALGCCSSPAPVNPKLAGLVDHMVAALGSAAKAEGPRTPRELAAIDSDVRAIQKHRAEGWRQ